MVVYTWALFQRMDTVLQDSRNTISKRGQVQEELISFCVPRYLRVERSNRTHIEGRHVLMEPDSRSSARYRKRLARDSRRSVTKRAPVLE